MESIAWEFINRASRMPMPSGMRRGQFLFNDLAEKHPDIAEKIRGTIYDPFYNDTLIPAFKRRIIELTS